MSCKLGNKAHKDRCTAYKNSGRRTLNKQKKAERHKKRMEKFAQRKADGKCYVYRPNPYVKGTQAYVEEAVVRSHKNDKDLTDYGYVESVFDKMGRKVAKAREEAKKKEAKESK